MEIAPSWGLERLKILRSRHVRRVGALDEARETQCTFVGRQCEVECAFFTSYGTETVEARERESVLGAEDGLSSAERGLEVLARHHPLAAIVFDLAERTLQVAEHGVSRSEDAFAQPLCALEMRDGGVERSASAIQIRERPVGTHDPRMCGTHALLEEGQGLLEHRRRLARSVCVNEALSPCAGGLDLVERAPLV